MFDLSHDLHSSPFIHFICQSVLIWRVVTISFCILKRIFEELSCYCLSSNIGSYCCFIVNESLNDRNNVSILCANIYNQTTLQGEKISWKDRWFVHKKSIKLIGFVKKLNKFLPILFAAQWWFNIKERVFWWIDKHFFA